MVVSQSIFHKLRLGLLIVLSALSVLNCAGNSGVGGNASPGVSQIFPSGTASAPNIGAMTMIANVEGGKGAPENTTSFQFNKVTIGGGPKKTVSSSASFKLNGAVNAGM
jgi:hypothetical protein